MRLSIHGNEHISLEIDELALIEKLMNESRKRLKSDSFGGGAVA